MRIVCLVADGFGVGEAPDAAKYGDSGSNTLLHICQAVGNLRLPNLERLGLGCLGQFPGIPKVKAPLAVVTRMAERSEGKDTTTGHWELAGLVTDKPFALFPQGFPEKLIRDFCEKAGVPGVLGNKAASGTAILDELGDEHRQTGRPIVYTSGDSVFQIAAHETTFGLDRLFRVCEIARLLTTSYQIGRVIARPFVGDRKGEFRRTEHRRDYSLVPPPNCLDRLVEHGISVCSVGKIDDIFAHRSITRGNHTGNNADSLEATLDFLKQTRGGQAFIFVNLVDFDMLFGHRRDPKGYARALENLDKFLPRLMEELGNEDCILLTADHGCDPTFKGTDHTREFVPLIAYRPGTRGAVLPDRSSFTEVATTVLTNFGVPPLAHTQQGSSVLCAPLK